MLKKGSLWIVVFVMLVLVLFGAALFSFSTSNSKIEGKIVDVNLLNSVYSQKDLAQFYLDNALESAVERSYNSAKAQGSSDSIFIKNYIQNNVKKDFQDIFNSYNFKEDYLTSLQNKIKMGNFEVKFKDDKVYLLINLDFNYASDDLNVVYNSDLNSVEDIPKV
ncbi:MAG: hypothetical protein Q7S56_01040 [Nanoarchaeota archaeon]|nr:hypothetical protein [Nanoarchaeota archaeon]